MSTSPVTLDFSKMQPVNQSAAPQNQNGGVTLDFSKMQPLNGQPQAQPTNPSEQNPSPSTLGGVGEEDFSEHPVWSTLEHVSNMGTNFIKGATKTGAGLGEMTGLLDKDQADYIRSETDKGAGSGLDRAVGYGGENLMEFLAGDEALSGLSGAEKLLEMGKITKILEGSPRLMKALQTGAGVLKGGVIGDETVMGMLSPAAREAIEGSPVLKRLLSAGIGAVRAGVTQGVQTTVRTGGDVKQGAKEGAEMGAVSGVIGGATGTLSGVLSKGADAAKNVLEKSADSGLAETEKESAREALTKIASDVQAPGKQATTDQVRTWLQQADDARHNMMEQGESSLVSRLEGETVDPQEAALAERAQQLLANPPVENSGEHEIEQEAKKASKDMLHPRVRSMLEMAASGEKPVEGGAEAADEAPVLYDANNRPIQGEAAPETEPIKDYDAESLIKTRKAVRKLAAAFPRGDINRRTLGEFMHGIDDTFQQVADQAGDDSAGADYQQLREAYKKSAENIDRSPYIQSLLNTDAGKEIGDFGSHLLKQGDKFVDKLENLQDVLQPQQMQQVRDGVANNLLSEGPDFLRKMSKEKVEKVSQLIGNDNMGKLSEAVKNAAVADGAAKLFDTQPTTIDNLKAWVGDDGMRDLTGSAMRDILQRVTTPDGIISPEKAIEEFEKVQNKPAYRKLFPEAEARQKMQAISQEFADAADWKTFVKRTTGVAIGVPGAVAGGAVAFMIPNVFVHLFTGAAEVLGYQGLKKLLHAVADSPKLWQYTKVASEAVESTASKEAGKGVRAVAGKGLAEALNGTASALGGK